MSDLTSATGQIPNPLGNSNRGKDIVFDGKQLTVTLEKINESIIGYLTNSIIPTIKSNGTALVVPVLYGDGERWAQVRKEGYLRDGQSDKLLAPLIMLRRTNAKPNSLNNPNNKYIHTVQAAGWNQRNVYDRFAVVNNIKPSQKLRTVMIPDYVDIEYDVIMWTELQSHMDSLIEQINVENYEFWGSRNNFKFRVSIDAFQGQGELPPTLDRTVRTEFKMRVAAYLLPERAVKNFKITSTSQTEYSDKKIVIKENIVNHL